MSKKKNTISLVIFIFVTLFCGVAGYGVDQILVDQPEGNSLGMGLWLVLPFLTGLIIRIVNKDWKDFGIKLHIKGNLKWYLVAFLVFPVVTLITILLAKISGGLIVNDVQVSSLPMLILTTFLANCIKNIFEEFAWRGNLVPLLEKTGINDWLLYLFSGMIWGMWHITYYMFFLPDEYFTDTSRPMMVISGIVIMILWAPLFTEIKRLTNSVWPCVFLHSLEDAIPTMLFVTANVFGLKSGYGLLLDPVSGIISIALLVAFGVVLRRVRIKKESKKQGM